MKPVKQRLKECIAIRAQLREHLENDSTCKELIDAMTHFVRDGTASSGSVYVPELGRKLEYTFSNKKDSYAVIKAPKGVALVPRQG